MNTIASKLRKPPSLAIGLPVFNGARWMSQTIQSIQEQTYSDFELIICDNASTDSTADICEQYANSDSRIRYFRSESNIGVFRNFDLVFHLSNTRYFKWWSVGDLCDPSFLQKCIEILNEREDVALVHSRTVLFSDYDNHNSEYEICLNLLSDDPAIRFRMFLDLARLNNVMNGVIRSRVLELTSLNAGYLGSDLVMVAEIAFQGKFLEIPENLFFRRMEPETATAKKRPREYISFYANEPSNVLRMPAWRFEYGLGKAIMNAPIGLRSRSGLLYYMLKRLYWNRRKLVDDLRQLPGA